MKKQKKNSGITLIALIITIIVLLILVGVSIPLVIGENGVINKAVSANEKTNLAHDIELRQLTMAEAAMNLENMEYIDKNEDKVTIPAGFAASQIEGENTVDDGLVIMDSKGNEFVWIPCDSKTVYEEAGEYSRSGKIGWTSWAYDVDAEGQTDGRYKAKTGWENPLQQIENAKLSIEKYNGFYIARYEAGVPSNASFYVASNEKSDGVEYKYIDSSDGTNIRNVNNLIPVSKKENQVWNFINQKNAKIVSEKMYDTNASVNSYLVDSNAWNHICKNILENIIGKEGLKDSKKWGNYFDNTTTDYGRIKGLFALHEYKTELDLWTYANSYNYKSIFQDMRNTKRVELFTGAVDDFKIYNIYDMAGNVWEWSAEVAKNQPYGEGNKIEQRDYAVIHGGSFNSSGYHSPLQLADGDNHIDTCQVDLGFRVVLYLK